MFATAVVAVISLIFFVVSNFVGFDRHRPDRRDQSIGLQIAIYYALAGFAAVVAFRKLAVQVAFRTSC